MKFSRAILKAFLNSVLAGAATGVIFWLVCLVMREEPTPMGFVLAGWLGGIAWSGIQAWHFNLKWQKAVESYSMPSYGEAGGEDR